MDGLFNGNREYYPRQFQTVDARLMAFVDQQVPTQRISGSASAMPAGQLVSAEAPRGFLYGMQVIGLGGDVSPLALGVGVPLRETAPYIY